MAPFRSKIRTRVDSFGLSSQLFSTLLDDYACILIHEQKVDPEVEHSGLSKVVTDAKEKYARTYHNV